MYKYIHTVIYSQFMWNTNIIDWDLSRKLEAVLGGGAREEIPPPWKMVCPSEVGLD